MGYGVGGLRREDVAIKGIPREVGSWRSRIGGVGTDGEEGEETSRQGCAEKGIVAAAAGTPFLEVGVMSRYQGTDMVEGLTVAGGLGVDDFFNFLFCLHIFCVFFAIFDMMRCLIFLTASTVIPSFSAISFPRVAFEGEGEQPVFRRGESDSELLQQFSVVGA